MNQRLMHCSGREKAVDAVLGPGGRQGWHSRWGVPGNAAQHSS